VIIVNLIGEIRALILM